MLCYHVDAVTVAASAAGEAVVVVAVVLLAEISLLLQLDIFLSFPPYPDRSFLYTSIQF